jgi:hypothetical protein
MAEPRRSPDYSVITKPRTKKIFFVQLPNRHDPEGTLQGLWELLQPGRGGNFVMTHGDVTDGVVRLVIEYSVRGGHASDVRGKLGRIMLGPDCQLLESECEVELRETVNLETPEEFAALADERAAGYARVMEQRKEDDQRGAVDKIRNAAEPRFEFSTDEHGVTQQSAVFKTPDFILTVYLRRGDGPEAVISNGR